MITSVSFAEFAGVVCAMSAMRAAARQMYERRRALQTVVADVLRLAGSTNTAAADRGCMAVVRAEVELLESLRSIALDGYAIAESIESLSDEELGREIRALLTNGGGEGLDTLDRMANDIANDIAATAAGK